MRVFYWCLPFLCLQSCESASAQSKQSQYVKSCEASFYKIITSRQPEKAKEAKEIGKESCADMAKNLTAKNSWPSIDDPRMDACSDVVFMMSNGDQDFRNKLIGQYCF